MNAKYISALEVVSKLLRRTDTMLKAALESSFAAVDCAFPAAFAWSRHGSLILRPLLLILILPFSLSIAEAAPADVMTPAVGTDGAPTAQQVEANRKAVESDTTLDADQKQKALALYDQVSQWLQQLDDARSQLAGFEKKLQEAPQRIEAIRKGTVRPPKDEYDIDRLLKGNNPEPIAQALLQEQLALQSLRDSQGRYADELARLLVGSKDLREAITAKSKLLDQINTDLQGAASNEPKPMDQARMLVLKARRALRQSETELLQLRLGNQDLLTNLAQAERDYAATEIARRQERVDKLTRAAQALRETQAREARQQAYELQSRTGDLPAALQDIARQNSRFREELEDLLGREQTVTAQLQTAKTSLDGIKSDFDRTRQRVEVVGASQVIGRMLARRRAELPSPQSYRRTSAVRGAEISRATDRQIEIDELLRDQSDMPGTVQQTLAGLPDATRDALERQATELVTSRRDALNELQKAYGRYIGQITSLDLANRQLVDVARSYIDYIDDQLIWIPGPDLKELLDPIQVARSLLWLATPDHWGDLLQDLWTLATTRPLRVALLTVLVLTLLRASSRSKRRISEIALETRKIRTDSFWLTLKTLLHTLVVFGAWPLLLTGSGWLLRSLPTASTFSLALASGLIKAGIVFFSLRFLIQICRTDGLGDRHLGWPTPARDAIKRGFNWLLPIAVPLAFLIATGSGTEAAPAAQLLGRIAFILLMLVSAAYIHRMLRRDGPLMKTLQNQPARSTLLQLHFLWFPLFMLLPLAFATSSALGYHASALHLENRVEQTFWFFVGLFLLKELLLRYLYIAERRLRLDDALRRREEQRAQRSQGETAGDDEIPGVLLDIPEPNYDALSEQTHRLVQAGYLFSAVLGVWSIWNDLLPALNFLSNSDLPLYATRIVDGVSQQVPITLGDLGIGLVTVIVTILASKNIPGVLEIALLQRLPLDPGARYAITTLSQYLIAGIGVFVAFHTLGLQWSSIQWLVAALSVGLGFGLQEIVANFISGIILLFERPIRVGDVVTIDNISGKVSRIRIRATTIVNWDKQELLIPNKEFITGRVINWTLTDKINRVVVTVGVAYDTDVEQAMQLMLDVARRNPSVLDDPAPVASFEAFGDNALTLQLRSYLGTMDNRLETITALHQAINNSFRQHGISIAYPQRDLHLDTNKPLDIRLQRAAKAPGGTGS